MRWKPKRIERPGLIAKKRHVWTRGMSSFQVEQSRDDPPDLAHNVIESIRGRPEFWTGECQVDIVRTKWVRWAVDKTIVYGAFDALKDTKKMLENSTSLRLSHQQRELGDGPSSRR
jgi:hypothetical protein